MTDRRENLCQRQGRHSANVRRAGPPETMSVNVKGRDRLPDAGKPVQPGREVHPGEGKLAPREDHAATGTGSLRHQLALRLPVAMAMVTSREHRQQAPQAEATLRQPCLHLPDQQTQHRPRPRPVLEEEAILHSVHLPDHAVVVVAVILMIHRATSLAHRVVAPGALVPVAVVTFVAASVVASMILLPLAHAALSAVPLLTRLPSVDPATRLRRRILAPCASATISLICQRRFQVDRRRPRCTIPARFRGLKRKLESCGR